VTCPECGTAMAQGARFCHACGWDARLPAAGQAVAVYSGRPAWQRAVMAVIVLLFTLWAAHALLVPRREAAVRIRAGTPAPDFTLQALDGGQVTLSDLKGKVVLINFWASWCTPCREEMPDIQTVYDRYKEQGLVVLAVNLSEPAVTVRSFVDRVGVNFPVLLDQRSQTERLYRILPLPSSFFLDRDGVIRYTFEGQMRTEFIENRVLQLLSRP
jgi:cytochrome c biogenesis protein CcmG, thiol:disulfide interchange protein DsbE